MIDIAIVALLLLGFVMGFFRGAVRQLLSVGVWLVAFLVGAYGRGPLGEWLGPLWPQYPPFYVDMLAFGIIFLFVFGVGLVLAQVVGARVTLTRHDWVDDLVGGFLGAALALLAVASIIVILDSGYEAASRPGGDIPWLRDLYVAVTESTIATRLEQSLITGLGAVLGPIMPDDIRAVMS